MLELADIIREYGDAYRARYGDRMLPSHKKALWDIEHCRTALMGGECWYCGPCDTYHYSYHSCQNRHCPKCESDRADTWRDRQLEKLLPVPYFLVTFTLPHEFNAFAHAHQKLFYTLLFNTSAEALKTLALNPKYVGGTIGMVGVLHTWDRSMGYHVHVHYLVPAGGWNADTLTWRPSHPRFLVPGSALSTIFRAKFRDALHHANPTLFAQVNPAVWKQSWNVHCKPVGAGDTALKYLAAYVYRVALSNRRLVTLEDGKVTFRYKPRKTPWTTMTLDVMRFLHRFLQHVLPKGFHKVRYTGFLHPSAHKTFAAIRKHLTKDTPDTSSTTAASRQAEAAAQPETPAREPFRCPQCGAICYYLGRLPPRPTTRGPP